MANNYGSLEGTMDANGILGGEIQFNGAGGKVKDVQVNDVSVVDANGIAKIDLTDYAKTEDIPTDLSDLQDDETHRLVTDAEKTEWSGKSNVSANPSTTTETLTGIEIDGTAYAIPSGDVTDVKVNDTSVVDENGVANIDLTGYAEKTDIHNPTITIQKNGQNVDTFTLNQTANKVIDISVPSKTSDLQNDSSFITNTVNNLANYYLKSDTYTQTEVNNLISAAVNGRFEKVTTLPASGEPNVIYLVPKTTALTNNVYDEYIWQDNAWELLGSTEIDLSNYVTTTDLSTALADYVTSSTFNTTIANYYTKTEVGNLLDGKVDKVSGKGLSTNDYDNTAKGIVDGVTNALAGKVDKVNGKGLSTEDYTTTEKNKLAGISTNANKVEASTTNGNIKIDDTETQVYDDSDIQGKIDETTTSISGNPISISGLKANQLAVNPIITFEPIQDLHGQSKPYPAGGGKNLFDIDNVPFGTVSNGVWTFGGTTAQLDITFKANTQYAFSGYETQSGANKNVRLRVVYTDDTTANVFLVTSTTRTAFTYISTANKSISYVQAYWGSDASATVAIEKFQIEEGNQATAYAPYENICPISGYDKVEALSCGKNLFDKSKVELGQINQTTGEDESSTTIYRTRGFIRVDSSKEYRIEGFNEAMRVFLYSDTELISSSIQYSRYSVVFPTNVTRIRMQSSTFNNFKDTLQVEQSSSYTDYEPYIKATDISEALGQTVYGGTLDVRTGKLTVDRQIVDLGDLGWNIAANNVFYSETDIGAAKKDGITCVCSCYNAVANISGTGAMTTDKDIALMNSTTNLNRVYVKDTSYSTASDFKTAVTGQKLVYELATPIVIQLTPHEISLLKDYAYVSTNGTSIALDYHNGELASLGDVAQVGETVNELGKYVEDVYGIKYGTFYVSVTANTRKTITTLEDIVEGTLPTEFGRCVFSLRAANETFPSSGVVMYNKTGETDTIAVLINATNSRLSINWIQFP